MGPVRCGPRPLSLFGRNRHGWGRGGRARSVVRRCWWGPDGCLFQERQYFLGCRSCGKRVWRDDPMRWLTRILMVLAVVATVGRESSAGEPDAAALAALIDRHIETR